MTIELMQGFVVGTLASLFGIYLFLKRRASLKSRLKKLESEEELVQKLRKSSVEYNRWNMQALFIVLFLICLANISEISINIFNMYPESPNEIFLPLVFWIVGAIVSFDEIVRSRNVRNIGKFKERTSKKRQKLESKLENQS